MVEPPPLPEIDWELVAATKNPLELFELFILNFLFFSNKVSSQFLLVFINY